LRAVVFRVTVHIVAKLQHQVEASSVHVDQRHIGVVTTMET
jgi:hypothetical protein